MLLSVINLIIMFNQKDTYTCHIRPRYDQLNYYQNKLFIKKWIYFMKCNYIM